MCDIYFGVKAKRKFGYKVVAVDKDNNVYSIFTGQMYKPGMVESPPVKANPITDWNTDLFELNLDKVIFYIPRYVGFTSSFVEKKDAIKFRDCKYILSALRDKYKLKIARFNYSGDTFVGFYQFDNFHSLKKLHDVIAGKYIESIQVLVKQP